MGCYGDIPTDVVGCGLAVAEACPSQVGWVWYVAGHLWDWLVLEASATVKWAVVEAGPLWIELATCVYEALALKGWISCVFNWSFAGRISYVGAWTGPWLEA